MQPFPEVQYLYLPQLSLRVPVHLINQTRHIFIQQPNFMSSGEHSKSFF